MMSAGLTREQFRQAYKEELERLRAIPKGSGLEADDVSGAWSQPWGSGLMAYLLDSDVFMQAKNLHYGLDFCPAFWDWLTASNAAGQVFSIEKVGDDIEAGADELAAWAAERGSGFFLKPDAAILSTLAKVSAWVTGQRYEPPAIHTFLQVSDYYLVAYALAHGHTIVTHEKASTSTKKIKISEPCIGLG